MKLNKYRLGSQLRSANWTMQETAFAPQIMRQQHDAAQQALLDQEEALQFEYADVDDQYVSPKIEALQNKISTTEQRLLKQGYNPSLQGELVSLRREYMKEASPKGTLGRAQSNYKAMQQALSEYDKNHAKDPEWFREKAKKNIIANYKGMQDEYGNFSQFTPGRATGYRDIGEDAVSYLKEAGASDQDLSLFREGKLRINPIQDGMGNTYLKIEQLTPGNITSNVKNLEAGLNQLATEYLNPDTDRGLSAQIAGYTPEHITGTLSNIGQMLTKNVMSDQPGYSARVQNVPTEGGGAGTTTKPSKEFTFPTITNVEYNTPLQKEINKETSKMSGAFEGGNFKPKTNKEINEGLSSWHPRNIWGDIKEGLSPLDPGYAISGEPLFESKEKESSQQKIWDKYKSEFEPLYNQYVAGKKAAKETGDKDKYFKVNGVPITSDEDWFNYAASVKQNYTAFLDSKINLSDYNMYDNLQNKAWLPEDKKLFKHSEDPKKSIGWKEIKEAYDDEGMDITKMATWMNSKGELEVQVPGKKKMEVYVIDYPKFNDSANLKKSLAEVDKIFKDYSWTVEEIEAQNGDTGGFLPIIEKELYIKPIVNPQNPAQKSLWLYSKRPVVDANGQPTGEYSWQYSNEPVTKSELMQLAAFGEETLLNKKFKP